MKSKKQFSELSTLEVTKNTKNQRFLYDWKYSISSSVTKGKARTNTYCERTNPNIGSEKAVTKEAKIPTPAIHYGL